MSSSKLFALFDENGNKSIDESEFLNGMKNHILKKKSDR